MAKKAKFKFGDKVNVTAWRGPRIKGIIVEVGDWKTVPRSYLVCFESKLHGKCWCLDFDLKRGWKRK